MDIAEDCIPKSSLSNKHTKVPWFNDECKLAKKKRKLALRRFRQAPTLANLLAFRGARARCRATMKASRRKSWRQFCSSLNSKAKSSTVWRAIHRIKGRKSGPSLQHLDAGGTTYTNKKDIANLLASTIQSNSSGERSDPAFKNIKKREEKINLNFSSDNLEEYNRVFTLFELKQALKKSNDTAPGIDGIHYQLLKHLPDSCLQVLLKIYNQIWETGDFPSSWREAIIIPIAKPGKDSKDPNNYRPIALTSCLCKTMERMVNTRLNWFLESNDKLAKQQCGFRKGHSTTDHLVRFEAFIREAFAEKKHVVAVFFDLEKAYDTTWRKGILKNLHEMGVRGRLAAFVEGFLEHRTFAVRAGSVLSDFYEQEMGVPQGSILSPALFNIKINDIVKSVPQDLQSSLFVDDFAICASARSLRHAERQVQLCINQVLSWVKENGFRFSSSKTVAIHFYNGNKIDEPNIMLGNDKINAVHEARFLGVLFDRKLSFLPHIRDLRAKCMKSLNILRVVGKTDWGADRKTLLHLYKALVRSKLDYGSIVYGSSTKTNLQLLDTVHHAGLRIALGAYRTSPVESLYTEAGETSLDLRRKKLMLNYVIKLKSLPDNPAYDCVFSPKRKLINTCEAHETFRKPLSLRVRPLLEKAGINLDVIEEHDIASLTAPWELEVPEVFLGLSSFPKESTSEAVYKQAFLELSESFKDFFKIFTDGSKRDSSKEPDDSSNEPKLPDGVGSAAFSKDVTFSSRLPDEFSVYSAELWAIVLALKMCYQSRKKKFIIFSDSLSALTAIAEKNLEHPLLQDIFERYSLLCQEGKKVSFAWVPSHKKIDGNVQADNAAKNAITDPNVLQTKTCFSDVKSKIKTYVLDTWQRDWNREPENKLYKVQDERSKALPRFSRNRKEETVLTRLHIGHTHMTHGYLLRDEEPPFCVPCDEPCTVEHILIECIDVMDTRVKHYTADNLKVLFRDVPPDKIFDFLREINVFYRI